MSSISKVMLSFSVAIALLIEGFSIRNDVQAVQYSSSSNLQNQAISIAQITVEDWLWQAVEKANRGDFRGAISDLDRAIELHPNNARLYANRAGLYLMVDEFERSEADATRAIALSPYQALAFFNRAAARHYLKKYQPAIEDYTQALNLGVPGDTLAVLYFSRGEARRMIRDLTGSIADNTTAIQIDPTSGEAYDNRGLAYLDQGDTEHAIADFQKAAELFKARGDQANYRAALARVQKLQMSRHDTKSRSIKAPLHKILKVMF